MARRLVLYSALLAGALAGAYLVWAPPSADLAAQTFRAHLFQTNGLAIWSNDWYGGFYLPGYSVLSPPLAAWLGPRLMGALAGVACAVLFATIAVRAYGVRALVGSLWLAVATATMLLSGRLTFALGVAFGLAALLALQRERGVLAAGLAALSSLASPVAGLFCALAGGAAALTGWGRRGAAMAAAALGAIAALGLAFPSGGVEPFATSSFVSLTITVAILLLLLPRDERTLRAGAWLYLALAVVLYAVPTPVGGNATRLAALFAGPVLALALAGRRNFLLAAAAPLLFYWQWVPPVRDLSDALADPSVHASFYGPLLAELRDATRPAQGEAPVRIEILPTRDRWEAAEVAPRFTLARGWLRQAESGDFTLFQQGNLTRRAYHRWLRQQGVSYVAVPRAQLDYLAVAEARLIARGLPYLDRIWSNRHWRLYAVRKPTPLAEPPARLLSLRSDSFALWAPRPGAYLVRVHYTRYWSAAGSACVEQAGQWTRVIVRRPGRVPVDADFSLSGLFGAADGCSA